ncbi:MULTISPECIES: trans-aconitate 2-methyltransferase [unclassified Streptomyces]|uniref:class I SAM-dependent methyltransferase n=1 Tax=unclassified Streptomyces TaxID=2593676 RepID=UPI00164461B1|nr:MULTISPECIES: class I SAM-dependent methyltransferase [unclassified Streptomyces]
MNVSMPTAQMWVDRWERQQQRYAFDREERFTVVADVVEHVTAGRSSPHVLDLGCGPGSLPARLTERLPHAEITAVDMDPLLLALARARHPDAARYVEAVIGEPGWTSALDLEEPVDAVVSTTALHYLPEHVLNRTYAELATLLRPGGVLINADHLSHEATGFAEITEFVGTRRAERQRAFDHEDWEAWWAAIENEPELMALCAERRKRKSIHSNCSITLERHVELLAEAGFGRANPVWQVGNSYVLVAILQQESV